MVTLDRQEIIATNKSLRLIKNELEHLLDKGVVDEDIFDQIHQLLPAESSLARTGSSISAQPSPQPQRNVAPPPPAPAVAAAAPPTPPVNAMASMALHANPSPSPAPPSYQQTGPPSLPARAGPPPGPPPSKPVLVHARALYRYQAADDRDLSFERDDRVAVHEYMNEDWWMGRNERTGAEGIFPKNYVQPDPDQKKSPPPPQQPYGAPQPYGGYGSPAAAGGYPPPPPGGQNPYNAHVPPMAVAQGGQPQQQPPAQEGEGSGGNSKMNEHGKKFGKKLGNAAIFGAGATMGSNLVNSIF